MTFEWNFCTKFTLEDETKGKAGFYVRTESNLVGGKSQEMKC